LNLMRADESRDAFALLLDRMDIGPKLDRFLSQSGVVATPVQLVVLCTCLCVIGAVVGYQITLGGSNIVNSIALGVLGPAIPIIFIWRKRASRMTLFESQFPDALDFIGRSMRAGHGLAISIELLTADSPEPLASEFRKVSNEIALGSTLDSALNRLALQVPLVDVMFFVSSVALQQVTGGNMSEILTNLAYLIRERFRLKADVRSASAHGRMTAIVLLMLPIAVAVLMRVFNHGYLEKFAAQPEGKHLLIGAACGELLGNIIIWRMVNFKI
jgi:tight adherence protein B